ncbi:MAG: FkbM family methyltransferase, partial [Pseudomonadota bacterium]
TLPTDSRLVPENVIDLIYRERYETQEAEVIQKELRQGDRVLELGAGIGFIGSLAAKICGSGNVRTYEANSNLEPLIRRTYELNGVTPDLHMKAIASSTGPVTFYQNDNVVSSSLVDRDFGGDTTVNGVSLSEVISEYMPDTIVCDIEGAEVDVFKGLDLSKVRTVLIELHPKIVGAAANDHFIESLSTAGLAFAYGRKEKVAFFKRA